MSTSVKQKITDFFTAYPLHAFPDQEIIIGANELPDRIFYIVSGHVSQYDITAAGNEVVVNIFKPGAFFPMSAVINNTPSQYFFETGNAMQARVVPAEDALRFLHENPDVVFDLLARVYRGVDGVLRRMAHLMGGNAKTRLLFELLNAAYRFGEPQPNGTVRITMAEQDIAKRSGLARETVNRTMRDLKASGLVIVERHVIILTDAALLEKMLSDDV